MATATALKSLTSWLSKSSLRVGLATLCMTTLPVYADTLEKINASAQIHLGYRPNAAPFSLLDASGQAQGYSVEICERIAKTIQKQLKLRELKIHWIPVGANEKASALTDGLIDIECADSTVTNASQKMLAFSVPIYIASSRLMVPAASTVQDLESLRGKQIVTITQSGHEAMLRYVLSQRGVVATVALARQPRAALAMLRQGQAEAFFADDATFFAARSSDADWKQWRILEKAHAMRPKSIAFRRDDPRLRSLILKEMQTLIATGALQDIYAKWLTRHNELLKANLQIPASYVLRETWKLPTDAYTDHAFGNLPD
jgi:ABC-type amino acid transport substrate-binding protein